MTPTIRSMTRTTLPNGSGRPRAAPAKVAGAARARSESPPSRSTLQSGISPNQRPPRTEQFGDHTYDDLPQFNDGAQDEDSTRQLS
jgi:hypothetical protein